MRTPKSKSTRTTTPQFQEQAKAINSKLTQLDLDEIKNLMKVSDNLAISTKDRIQNWATADKYRAIELFAGDIYTKLDANSLSAEDLDYAQKRLLILSGLYGILRPLDLIAPYRLEMGHRIRIGECNNLYEYWGNHLEGAILKSDTYLHLSSEEYFKTIKPIINPAAKVIAPIFLTLKNNTAKQVTIHSKVARGAYVNWLLRYRIEDINLLPSFDQLDYIYSDELSTELNPTYIRTA